MELERLASDVGMRAARDLDSFVLVSVGAKYPLATTHRAIAGGCSIGLAFELPSNRAAVTGSLNHVKFASSIWKDVFGAKRSQGAPTCQHTPARSMK